MFWWSSDVQSEKYTAQNYQFNCHCIITTIICWNDCPVRTVKMRAHFYYANWYEVKGSDQSLYWRSYYLNDVNLGQFMDEACSKFMLPCVSYWLKCQRSSANVIKMWQILCHGHQIINQIWLMFCSNLFSLCHYFILKCIFNLLWAFNRLKIYKSPKEIKS